MHWPAGGTEESLWSVDQIAEMAEAVDAALHTAAGAAGAACGEHDARSSCVALRGPRNATALARLVRRVGGPAVELPGPRELWA